MKVMMKTIRSSSFRSSARRIETFGIGLVIAALIVAGCAPLPVSAPAAPASAPAEAATLEVRPASGATLSEEAVQTIAALDGVADVAPYLLIKSKPHNVIGVAPGAPLRVLGPDKVETFGQISAGRNFEAEDAGERVAVVGRGVAAEDYGGGSGAMAGMRHLLDIGASFLLTDQRVRVIGRYSPSTGSGQRVATGVGEDVVFLPLDTAQRIFDQDGQVSVIFVSVASADKKAAVAQSIQEALGDAVEVVTR